jgi:hypothetical protein
MLRPPKPPKNLAEAQIELFDAMWRFCVASKDAGVPPDKALALVICSFLSIAGFERLDEATSIYRSTVTGEEDERKRLRRDLVVDATNTALQTLNEIT